MSKEHRRNRGTNNEPLTHYLKDVSSLPRLTPEEEMTLARRICKGDREALHKLVEGNLRFVVYMAAKYRDSRLPLSDLINEGNIGLLKAAEKFDPERGVKFISYAVWWIKSQIELALSRQVGVIRVPQRNQRLIRKIYCEKEDLRNRLDRDPTKEELAKASGLSLKTMESYLMAARPTLSLDVSFFEDPGFGLLDTLKADFDIEAGLTAENLREEITGLLNVLPKRKREIVMRRFGLNGYEKHTLRETGSIMGLSRERVRQIEYKALRELGVEAKHLGF